jgi:hypothetical protein
MGHGFFMIHIKTIMGLSYQDFQTISSLNHKWISDEDKKVIHKALVQEVIKQFKNHEEYNIIDSKCVATPEQGVLTIRFKLPYKDHYILDIVQSFEKMITDVSQVWNLSDYPIREFKLKSVIA